MHPLPALCPEGGHFGHLLESLIIWGIGIALTHSHLFTFHFSLTKSFFSFLSASLDPLISGLVSNEAHLALISPSRSFFYYICYCFWSDTLPFHDVNGPFSAEHSKLSPSPYHFIQTLPEIFLLDFVFISNSKQNWTKTISLHPVPMCT